MLAHAHREQHRGEVLKCLTLIDFATCTPGNNRPTNIALRSVSASSVHTCQSPPPDPILMKTTQERISRSGCKRRCGAFMLRLRYYRGLERRVRCANQINVHMPLACLLSHRRTLASIYINNCLRVACVCRCCASGTRSELIRLTSVYATVR